MSTEKFNYAHLERVLIRLGYTVQVSSDRIVFRHEKTHLPILLRRMKRNEILNSLDLLNVKNALAYGGIVPKEKFDDLFELGPIQLWHAIVDAEAEYETEHGRPPKILKLPVVQAYDLAKLQTGPLAERVLNEGIRVFEREGLLGIPVELVPGEGEFSFQ